MIFLVWYLEGKFSSTLAKGVEALGQTCFVFIYENLLPAHREPAFVPRFISTLGLFSQQMVVGSVLAKDCELLSWF